ncbi:PREDICTED: death domain-associated protein 6 [Gekko japonicus]|uniref:Death domain-associated protein 6 n=1 Tax=Gekko japonicus TaxID=146911 RepID=A0ABM1KGS9_GEKJA|nr:PREDICTED: death domain-associated protein 6 [Gekko japonicus]
MSVCLFPWPLQLSPPAPPLARPELPLPSSPLQFVDFCSQHTAEHPEVIPYLASRHQKSSPQFLASVEFRNVLGRCLSRVQGKRSKVYVYINELCTVFKAHSQKRKLALSSSASASATEASAAAPSGPPEPQAEPPQPRRGSKRQIRYLENLLQVYAVEIRRLQERELDLEELDREDSAYLQENRLKRRMMRIFERLCELKDCNSLTGRVIEQRIPYRGTRYPEVNRRIERLINHPEAFPDYNDILKVVQKADKRHSLGLPKRQMESMAADAFREVGNRLQERRHLDLVYNFGSHLTDQYRPGSDPALVDSELARRLRHNREEALQRLEHVVAHYAQLQDKGEEEEWRQRRKRGEPASPTPSGAAGSGGGKEDRLSPRAPRKGALQADQEEEEEEEEEEEDSSSESDLEAELEKSLEEGGEEEEEGPAPDEEDPPGQEVEADQQMGGPEATDIPEVILYSSTEEEEEEEDEEEAAAAPAAEEEGEEGAPPGVELPHEELFGLEVEETQQQQRPPEGSETPPPSPPPLPWGFSLRRPSPLRSPAPVADSTCADSPSGLALVTSSQGSPAPVCKASVATQCDPEEIIVLSDSD